MFKNNFHILMTDASDYTVKALLSPLSIKPPSLLSPLSYLDLNLVGLLMGVMMIRSYALKMLMKTL